MAFVSLGFRASFTLIDVGNDPTVKTYELRAASAAVAQTAAEDILPILEAVTNSKVGTYTVSQVFAEDAFIPPVVAGARNSMQALISVAIASNPLKTADLSIPAPVAAVFESTTGPNSDIVDSEAAIVIAYVDMFKAAGLAYISDGETVAANSQTRGIRRTVKRRLAKV